MLQKPLALYLTLVYNKLNFIKPILILAILETVDEDYCEINKIYILFETKFYQIVPQAKQFICGN